VSLGAQVCSGIPLVVECFERVSASLSPVGGLGISLNLNVDGRSIITYVMARKSSNNSTHC